ncbi:sulfotransferase [Plakobranchus ocellatus]|uniref:Sulfotransferase n=1 Tax=Plakobranchus ocellatus TaxID=259542 RepID=A0AAV4BT55_9GAST|nr:sulfotransferase [Plakobranchus ocellatus]
MTKVPGSGKKFSHMLPGQHVYHGILFFGFSPPDTLEAVREFGVRGEDVFIVTYPKAGTTWMQEIVWLLLNDADFAGAAASPVYMRSPFLEFKDDVLKEVGLDIAEAMPSPRVIKTHLPLKLMPKQLFEKKPKVIVLFRNPKDVCCSYYNFYRSSSSFGDFQGEWPQFLDMFMEGHVDHGSWFDFTKSWWPLNGSDNFRFVFYEDLKMNLLEEVKKLALFLGKTDLSPEMLTKISDHCSFESMKTNPMTNHEDVYSIDSSVSPLLRKGTVGDWKNHFTVQQNEDFDREYKEKMSECSSPIPFKYFIEKEDE